MKASWWEVLLGILAIIAIGASGGCFVYGYLLVTILGYANTTTLGVICGSAGIATFVGIVEGVKAWKRRGI